MLDIISVGPGEAVLLTDDAKQAMDRADAALPFRAARARHGVPRTRPHPHDPSPASRRR